jgi:hypothetical protein
MIKKGFQVRCSVSDPAGTAEKSSRKVSIGRRHWEGDGGQIDSEKAKKCRTFFCPESAVWGKRVGLMNLRLGEAAKRTAADETRISTALQSLLR